MNGPREVRRLVGRPLPDGAVYVGVGSKWASPFRVEHDRAAGRAVGWPDGWMVRFTGQGRTELFGPFPTRWEAAWLAAGLYRAELVGAPEVVAQVRAELAGRVLACWCRVGWPCHRTVLLQVANSPVSIRWEGAGEC